MASLIDQMIGAVRGIFSGPPPVEAAPAAAAPSDGLTGVQRYLNALAGQSEPKLTGVAKYLAQLAEAEAEAKAKAKAAAAAAEAKTGVQKYLVKHADSDLAQLSENLPDTAAVEAAAAALASPPVDAADLATLAAEGKTGVQRYLEIQAETAQPKAEPAPEAAAAPAAPEPAQAEAAPVAEPEAATGVIDLSAGAKQCQGSTLKGTQCKHTTALNAIQRTIDGQAYQFLACGHHSGNTFKPYAGLIK